MHDIGNIRTYQPRWQCIVLLCATLANVRGGLTKAEAIAQITQAHWFDIQPEDRQPYRSAQHTTHEARWITLIAFARKDLVERRLMDDGPRDNWDLSAAGRDCFESIAALFRSMRLDACRCFLWTAKFKSYMSPTYSSVGTDAVRPRHLYSRDWRQSILDSL
jgi:hypothetical protein